MKATKKSLKLTLAMVGGFLLLALCARVTERALPTSADVSEKPIIVLDAGHGGADPGSAVRHR